MKKQKRRSKGFRLNDIKKTLAFRLLIICIIILFILVVVWILVYEPQEVHEEGFGLPSLLFGPDVSGITLEVLDYNITDNNQTIQINVSWASGSGEFEAVYIRVFKPTGESCDYINQTDLLSGLGEQKTYTLSKIGMGCDIDFADIAGIENLIVWAGTKDAEERISDLWDSFFMESSEGIRTISDSVGSKDWNRSLSYKRLADGNMYVLTTLKEESTSFFVSHIGGFYGNFSEELFEVLEEIHTPTILDLFFESRLGDLEDGDYVQGNRSMPINNISEASQEYNDIFNLEEGSWEHYSFFNELSSRYYFEEGDLWEMKRAYIYENIEFDKLYQGKITLKPINLTQIKPIEDINSSLENIVYDWNKINLYEYFVNLGYDVENISVWFASSKPVPLGFIEWYPSSQRIEINPTGILNESLSMNITLSHPDWNGGANVTTNNFNVDILWCNEYGDFVENATSNATDYCISSNTAMDYFCWGKEIRNFSENCFSGYVCIDRDCVDEDTLNHAPKFKKSVCDDLVWNVSTNLTLNMTECWEDEDNDTLQGFRYVNDNANLTISVSNNTLLLAPDIGWNGSGDFNIYVNDSFVEVAGEVNFRVTLPVATLPPLSLPTPAATTVNVSDPEIKSEVPPAGSVSLTGENKTFTITAENYDSIKWYLNGTLLPNTGLSITLAGLNDRDVVKVEVINGTKVDSKVWSIVIPDDEDDEDDETPKKELDVGLIIFYSIIAVIFIIILLVIWLFISEKNRRASKGEDSSIVLGGSNNVGKSIPSNQLRTPAKR